MNLEYFANSSAAPPYAILSHTWGNDEVLFDDYDAALQAKFLGLFKTHHKDIKTEDGYHLPDTAGISKILGFCKTATSLGLEYGWLDTLCIDKKVYFHEEAFGLQ